MSQTILLIGAGAIGSAVAAWLAPQHEHFYVFDKPETIDIISQNGVSAYLQHHQDEPQNIKVKTLTQLEQCPVPDIILLCVKNYSLAGLSQTLLEAFGKPALKNCIVVGLQNGIENQKILPQYFTNVVYGIVSFNAWLDSPGVVGYQSKGPFIFGTADNSNHGKTRQVCELFNVAVPAQTSQHFQDAALCKMVINLTNSFTTLSGLGYIPIDNMALFQKILSNLTYEGVKIVKAAGHKECKIGDTPGWLLIKASALLPQFLTRALFKRNVKKMVLSSMAQDVIQNAGTKTELQDINGYLLALADKYQVDAPYNRAIYQLCQEFFSADKFQPLSIDAIWQKMALR